MTSMRVTYEQIKYTSTLALDLGWKAPASTKNEFHNARECLKHNVHSCCFKCTYEGTGKKSEDFNVSHSLNQNESENNVTYVHACH